MDGMVGVQRTVFSSVVMVAVQASLAAPMTVRVTLAAPNGGFPTNMAWGDAVIVSPESVDQAATAPVGFGLACGMPP